MGVKAGVESMYIRRRSGDGAKEGGGLTMKGRDCSHYVPGVGGARVEI